MQTFFDVSDHCSIQTVTINRIVHFLSLDDVLCNHKFFYRNILHILFVIFEFWILRKYQKYWTNENVLHDSQKMQLISVQCDRWTESPFIWSQLMWMMRMTHQVDGKCVCFTVFNSMMFEYSESRFCLNAQWLNILQGIWKKMNRCYLVVNIEYSYVLYEYRDTKAVSTENIMFKNGN